MLVDDFDLVQVHEPATIETRQSNITLDADFAQQTDGAIAPPWFFANIGGARISGRVVPSDDDKCVVLAMSRATSNYESAQLWQHVDLCEGVPYSISCRMRWDNFAPDTPAPLVNYGIYHEPTGTWYGPVDQTLEKTGQWRTYCSTHIPPFTGRWKLYVQLNGWGNLGHGVTMSLDDFTCTPQVPSRPNTSAQPCTAKDPGQPAGR